jgi:hypothetical protein
VEQEVLLVEEVIDPEIEREIFGGVVMDLHVHDEVVIEGAVDVGDDVGVIQRRILLAAVARRDGIGPGRSPGSRVITLLRLPGLGLKA